MLLAILLQHLQVFSVETTTIFSVNLYMKYLHRIVQTSTSVTGLVCLVSN